MTNKSAILIYEELTFHVGEDLFIDSVADNNHAVVFEDDGETGYFYTVDRTSGDLKILDGLHIYNVADVTDKDKPSVLQLLWTEDETKAILSINNYYHAVFDFKRQAGYCRTGFPSTTSDWIKIKDRKLTDDLLNELLTTIK